MRAIQINELPITGSFRISSLACAIASVLLLCPFSIGEEQREADTARYGEEKREAAARRNPRAALEELEQQKQVLMQKHLEVERQRQLLEEQLARQNESQAEHAARVQAELQRAQAQLAELAARQEAAQSDPLPENTQLQVFNMRHIKPRTLAEALTGILLNNMPRIAVDERSNALLVAGNEKQLAIVEQLAETLDQPTTENAKPSQPAETFQVRVVWLLDGVDGQDPARGKSWENEKKSDGIVGPQVVEALFVLGFKDPKVVCQQVSTITLGGESDRTPFNFKVPVLINSQPWQFEGHGEIEPLMDNRFNLRFELRYQQSNTERFGGGRGSQVNQGQLGGSLYIPLAHYMVMGTTTFVANQPRAEGEDPKEQQHLSAFVVYLDRAREFPAASPAPKDATDEQP